MVKLKLVFDGEMDISIGLREDDTPTVKGLVAAAPFSANVNRWGDEIYFETPTSCGLEADARDEMSVGEVAYWPDGNALAIFFGRTPVSKGDEPRAYSPCNVVGMVEGDAGMLRSVGSGARVDVLVVEQ
jgi:hypothetical protein